MLKWMGTRGLVLLAIMVSTGCSLFPENEESFKSSRSTAPLEAPPGINLPNRNAAYDIPEAGSAAAAPLVERGMQIQRDGQLQWLHVAAKGDPLWQRLLAFWEDQNIRLEEADQAHGLMKTMWIESGDGVPEAGLKGMVSKALGTSAVGVREQYSVRVESANNGSKVYLSHRGAVLRQSDQAAGGWELSQADPEQASKMLTRLRLFLQHN